MTALLVALAGGLGAATRLIADGAISARSDERWPLGTIVINVTGSFALGLLVGANADHEIVTVAGVGFLGGYTTFSAISFQAAERALTGHGRLAAGVAVVTLVVGLGAAALGVWLGTLL